MKRGLLDPDAALRRVLSRVPRLKVLPRPLASCLGAALGRDLRARCDLPGFDNSAVDGYAARARDARKGTLLRLAGRVAAGRRAPRRLRAGEAVQVMTGAPLPPGADAVVMREDAREEGGRVRVLRAASAGGHVRKRGSDVRRGDLLLRAGARVRPFEIALSAAQGLVRLPVRRVPRVAWVSTGDELRPHRSPVRGAQVRDALSPAVSAAVAAWGFACRASGPVPDRTLALRAAFRRALAGADMLLVGGGASVGDRDFTRAALDALGFKPVFWRVAMRPGRPLLFGLLGGKPVFGVPGNPVSALVCLERFVRPALERMAGLGPRRPRPVGRLEGALRKPAFLRQYVFCRARLRGGRYVLSALKAQGSGLLARACRADALASGPIGLSRLDGRALEFDWL